MAAFPRLSAFYERFGAEPQTKAILESGGNMPGPASLRPPPFTRTQTGRA